MKAAAAAAACVFPQMPHINMHFCGRFLPQPPVLNELSASACVYLSPLPTNLPVTHRRLPDRLNRLSCCRR